MRKGCSIKCENLFGYKIVRFPFHSIAENINKKSWVSISSCTDSVLIVNEDLPKAKQDKIIEEYMVEQVRKNLGIADNPERIGKEGEAKCQEPKA